MTTNPSSTMLVERVDDIPLLLTQMIEMGIPELLDTNFPTHNNWDSLRWTTTIWLTHILSQADHRLNKLKIYFKYIRDKYAQKSPLFTL